VALAKENGFVPCSLGEARLRTETAAIVACHTIQLINQMKGKIASNFVSNSK
jgi:16S rRNA (uracil1498-N3)-methyltransferase